MLTITLSVLAVIVGVAGLIQVTRRHRRKAQATYDVPVDQEPELMTDNEIAKELAERRAFDAAVRQELEQCTDEELEAVGEPIFMFKADCDPKFRRRITTRQRVAKELLAERSYQPGNVTIVCSRACRGSKSFQDRLRD